MRYLIVRGTSAPSGAVFSAFASEARASFIECVVLSPSGARLTIFVESPDPASVAPRVPVDDDRDRLIWYDGFPLHDEFDAFDVREIDRRRAASSDLIGRFAVLRLDKLTNELEIRTDPFGGCPVYLATLAGKDWALTNDPSLAHRIAKPGDLDRFGAAGALCSPGPIGNHTLITTVRVLGHASHTIASPDRTPSTVCSDKLVAAGSAKSDLSPDRAAELFASRFGPIFGRLAEAGFDLRCALTGGRDSRAIAALVASSVENPRYHFGGAVNAPESLIAARVAEALGGEFTLKSDPNNPITDNYGACERHLLQRDCGMVDFSFLRPPPGEIASGVHRETHLIGQAGEFARWSFESLTGLIFPPSVAASRHRLLSRVTNNGGGLFTADAHDLVRARTSDLVDIAHAAGVTRTNVQTVVVNQLKAYRWASMQLRRAAERRDVFAPFLTEPFIQIAVRMNPRDRFADAFHKALIRRCAPEALGVPFHGYKGTAAKLRNETIRNLMLSVPAIKNFHARRKSPGRHAKWEPWLRPILRERLLSHDHDAAVWHFVHRDRAEQILTDDTGELFRSNIYPMLAAATVIRFWDHYNREMSGSSLSASAIDVKPIVGAATARSTADPAPSASEAVVQHAKD
tara:strand:+ start:4844 stop:6736 length:1893 start_codon:yes stop_codon:yes gene_type:complete